MPPFYKKCHSLWRFINSLWERKIKCGGKEMNSKLGSENKFQKCRYIFGWGPTCLILYFEKKKKRSAAP